MDTILIDIYGDTYTIMTEGDVVVGVAKGKYLQGSIESKEEFPLKVKKEVEEFLEGKRKDFDFKVQIKGTDFEKKVYEGMIRIPYGRVMSYGDLAIKVGHPGAARAVGTACAKNNIPFIIPCHRVVASNGIGGFGELGVDLKIKLLEMERENA